MNLDKYHMRSMFHLTCGHTFHTNCLSKLIKTNKCLQCDTPLSDWDLDKLCLVCHEPLFIWNQYKLYDCNHSFHRLCAAKLLLESQNAKCPRCNSKFLTIDKIHLRNDNFLLSLNVPFPNNFTMVDFSAIPNICTDLVKLSPCHCRSHIPGLPIDTRKEIFIQPSDEWLSDLNTGLTFSDKNLNLAAYCLKQFLKTCYRNPKSEWFHLKIPVEFHERFYEAMLRSKDCFILPFWCFCYGKGNNYGDTACYHRHVILVSPFAEKSIDVWKTFESAYAVLGSNLSKSKIDNPSSLLDALGHVSQRNSDCQHLDDKKFTNRFVIRGLPDTFKWILACIFDRGLELLIRQEAEKLSLHEKFLLARMDEKTGRYYLFPQDLPNIPLNLVLPVSKTFRPTTVQTKRFLYFCSDRRKKMYFEMDERFLSLDDLQWGELQSKLGNVIFNFIYDSKCLNLSEKEIEMFNVFKLYGDKIKALQNEIEELKKESTRKV